MRKTCSISDCDRIVNARGWCGAHYKKWKRYGDPLASAPSWDVRFWSKVNKSDSCWEWTGLTVGNGYGRFWDANTGRMALAHRLAYEMVRGAIPPGLHIDHLCRNRKCVNPEHLEAVTQRVNNMRSARGCAEGCQCGKHGVGVGGRPCARGCTCGRHSRQAVAV